MAVAFVAHMPDDTTVDKFSDALVRLMDEREISVRQLAKLTGLSHGYLSQLRLEYRGSRPTAGNIETIAKALGVPPTYFREYREHQAREAAAGLAARIGLEPVLEALAALDERAAARVSGREFEAQAETTAQAKRPPRRTAARAVTNRARGRK